MRKRSNSAAKGKMRLTEQRFSRLYIALASYDERELRVRKNYLEERNPAIVCICFTSGEALLRELKEQKIDVVVLSNQLDDMDGHEFMERLNTLRNHPLLLLQGDGWYGDTTAACLRPSGRNYLLGRRRLQDLLQDLRVSSRSDSLWVVPFCKELYNQWGIVQPDNNSEYLTSALIIACEGDRKMGLRKEILQVAGEQNKATLAAVDSGLRRLIDGAEARNTEGWQKFKEETGLKGQKVTIGKLIAAMREKLLRERPLDEKD